MSRRIKRVRKKVTNKEEFKFNPEDKFSIGFIIPVTSNKRNYKEAKDTDFFKILFPSFLRTVSSDPRYSYSFYLGYDDDDHFYLNHLEEMKQHFNNVSEGKYKLEMYPMRRLKGKVGQIWTNLALIASQECDYLYQSGDDIEYLTSGWEDIFIPELIKKDNIGVVGPYDVNRNIDTLLTQSFVHITHLKIFGYYYPPEIENWYVDDWITNIYDQRSDKRIKVRNSGGPPRYKVNNDKKNYLNILRETKPKLENFKKDITLYKENDIVTEDLLLESFKNKAVYHTRKITNINNIYKYTNGKNPIVFLTGYNNVVSDFFTKNIGKFQHPIILVTVESDVINTKQEYLNHPKLKSWYTWNKTTDHPKLFCIPIGLNMDRQMNGILEIMNKKKIEYFEEREKLLLVNFGKSSHHSRGKILELAKEKWSSFSDSIEYYPNESEYYKKSFVDGRIKIQVGNRQIYQEMKKFKFVLSPRGAGEDCHRTWEALYLGCIPVVLSSSINEIYQDLPVLVLDSWDQISKEFLEEKWEEMKIKTYDYDRLKLDFWVNRIKNKINFITYSNDKFARAKQRLLNQAKDFGEFDTITGYGPSDLDSEFREKYKDVLSQSRGGGYWIWRYHLIQKLLKKMQQNEILIYIDAGCHLNSKGKERFHQYIEMLKNSEYGMLSFQMHNQLEKWWTVKEIFDYFEIEREGEIGNQGQYLGGILFIKKCQHSEKFIDRILQILEEDRNLFTDFYNSRNQGQYFKDNRHEQSVSSILRKIVGSEVIPKDETWCPPFGNGESLKYPIWAKRDRN